MGGFSGREITKMMNGLQTHLLQLDASRPGKIKWVRGKIAHTRLTHKVLFEVVTQKIQEHQTTQKFAQGYNYQHSESGSSTRPSSPGRAEQLMDNIASTPSHSAPPASRSSSSGSGSAGV